MNTVQNLYKKIREFRQKARLTPKELADKTGLSHEIITSIEQGKHKITVEELLKFCEAFGCSYYDLLVADQSVKSTPQRGKKNILELYDEYKEKYQKETPPQAQRGNPLDNYLRKVNPYYYPPGNHEIKYGR